MVTRGKCKWFNSSKGYGFIQADETGEEYFVHQSDIHAQGFRSLAENEPVEFRIQTDANGRNKAVQVTGPNGDFVRGEQRDRDDFRNGGRGGFRNGGGRDFGGRGGFRNGGGGGYDRDGGFERRGYDQGGRDFGGARYGGGGGGGYGAGRYEAQNY